MTLDFLVFGGGGGGLTSRLLGSGGATWGDKTHNQNSEEFCSITQQTSRWCCTPYYLFQDQTLQLHFKWNFSAPDEGKEVWESVLLGSASDSLSELQQVCAPQFSQL